MSKNIIFCFTGTGNSLKVSKDIAAHLSDCEIYPMNQNNCAIDIKDCERIGFLFPVYFLGLPIQVSEFLKNLKLPDEFHGYHFAIATCANFTGNALRQANDILAVRNHPLQYAETIKMGDNAIAFYNSHVDQKKLSGIYDQTIKQLQNDILSLRIHSPSVSIPALQFYNSIQTDRLWKRDQGFEIADSCINCGLCARVCPAGNIDCQSGQKPVFKHKCQQCMACIQYCPKRAIDYKGKCADRTRYHHWDITAGELSRFQKQKPAI